MINLAAGQNHALVSTAWMIAIVIMKYRLHSAIEIAAVSRPTAAHPPAPTGAAEAHISCATWDPLSESYNWNIQ